MLRKFTIISLILTFVFLSFSGASCFSPKGKETTGEKVTLTFWGLFDNEEVWKQIIDSFQYSYPNIKVDYIKKNPAEYELNTSEALAAGRGPDVWMIRSDWMPRHSDKLVPIPDGELARMTKSTGKKDVDVYKEKFPPIAVSDNVIDNKIYGMPMSIDTLALYYNNDMFNKKNNELIENDRREEARLLDNPPADWDTFIKIVKLFTEKNGNNISIPAVALGSTENVDKGLDILTAIMLQNNTTMTAADKKSAAFNLSTNKSSGEPYYPGTKALEFFTSFTNPGKETYTWNESMPNSIQAFMDQKIPMMINYSFIQKKILQERPTLNYKIGPLPQIKDTKEFADYANYFVETVTKNSKHPKEAWEFIIYAVNNGSGSYSSATKSPKPFAIDKGSLPINNNQRISQMGSLFEFQKMTAKSWYKGKRADKTDQIFIDMVENIVKFNQPHQTSIDTAATKLTNLLQLE